MAKERAAREVARPRRAGRIAAEPVMKVMKVM
jgi:hypothetical protein